MTTTNELLDSAKNLGTNILNDFDTNKDGKFSKEEIATGLREYGLLYLFDLIAIIVTAIKFWNQNDISGMDVIWALLMLAVNLGSTLFSGYIKKGYQRIVSALTRSTGKEIKELKEQNEALSKTVLDQSAKISILEYQIELLKKMKE